MFMTRPCFLVLDREFAGSISTRKLVIETAKLNVITAYSGREAMETYDRFPNLDGAVLDSRTGDVPCEELVSYLKAARPAMPIIVIGSPGGSSCGTADHFLDAFEPGKLLDLLKALVPAAGQVMEREKAEKPTQE